MGCDIHMHVEYKRRSDGRWVCGDYFYLNPYYGEDEEEKEYELVGFFDSRNYTLFSTLANVRNYGNTPFISNPRGLPEDVSSYVQKDAEYWGDDGHSHSWLTLKELIDFDKKNIPIKHRGMISPEAQKQLDLFGTLPKEWCQGTNIDGWEFREWEEHNHILKPLIEKIKERLDDLYVIYSFEWDRTPEEAYQRAENARIVFWFDN